MRIRIARLRPRNKAPHHVTMPWTRPGLPGMHPKPSGSVVNCSSKAVHISTPASMNKAGMKTLRITRDLRYSLR